MSEMRKSAEILSIINEFENLFDPIVLELIMNENIFRAFEYIILNDRQCELGSRDNMVNLGCNYCPLNSKYINASFKKPLFSVSINVLANVPCIFTKKEDHFLHLRNKEIYNLFKLIRKIHGK